MKDSIFLDVEGDTDQFLDSLMMRDQPSPERVMTMPDEALPAEAFAEPGPPVQADLNATVAHQPVAEEPAPGMSLTPDVFEMLRDQSYVKAMSTPPQDRRGPYTDTSPEFNTLPARLPEGVTPIDKADYPFAVKALAVSYPSMNEMGILLDPMERAAYARSVMNNRQLRSDIKSQFIDQMMRDGKIVPEALGRDWYESRNISLRPPPQQMGPR